MKDCSFALFVWFLAAFVFISTAIAYASGFRINPTHSIPMGLWKLESMDGPVKRGMVVSFCPVKTKTFELAHKRGYMGRGKCPSGLEPLFKPVVAVAGDTVEVSATGVSVNGNPIPNSAALLKDDAGRQMPILKGRYIVAPGSLWLISSFSSKSFDSRYFGPVSVSEIQGQMQPIWVEASP